MKKKGFTLVEMVIVIVVIGILAAVASSKFFDFSGNAKESVVKGVMGSLDSGLGMIHAKHILGEETTGITFSEGEGLRVDMTGFNKTACKNMAQVILSNNSIQISDSSLVPGQMIAYFKDDICYFYYYELDVATYKAISFNGSQFRYLSNLTIISEPSPSAAPVAPASDSKGGSSK